MKKKPKDKPPETLGGLFDTIARSAKSNAAAGEELAKYLMSVVGGIKTLTNNLTEEINETLAALDKEMEGKKIMEASSTALRLGGRAQGLAWVAGQISAMVDQLKEETNETVH
jgi:gas vesicle protein